MKLIVGLGNPGEKYEHNRHNLGFRIVGHFLGISNLDKHQVNVPDLKGHLTKVDGDILVLRPINFMNQSGVEVKKVMQFFKIDTDDLLVIHDDVDLAFGELKAEKNRGSAGHKGVESVNFLLGTQDYWRLRMGVGRPPEKVSTDQFVLKDFSAEEEKKLQNIFNLSFLQIHHWLSL